MQKLQWLGRKISKLENDLTKEKKETKDERPK